MFDLAQTQRLFELSEAKPAERDAAWSTAFFPAAWYASLEVGQTFRGPDYFPYLRMHLPLRGKPFESNSLGNVARGVVEQGLGVALFASPEAPEPIFVFSMGMLGSLLEYDSPEGDPIDLQEIARSGRGSAVSGDFEELPWSAGQKIFTGSPASSYFAPYTARALERHLRDGWKLAEPRVALLVNASAQVSRNLVISKKMSEFADREMAARQSRMLLWYLPPKRSVLLMPEGWTQDQMRPMKEFFAVK